jgi:hypothetical protein
MKNLKLILLTFIIYSKINNSDIKNNIISFPIRLRFNFNKENNSVSFCKINRSSSSSINPLSISYATSPSIAFNINNVSGFPNRILYLGYPQEIIGYNIPLQTSDQAGIIIFDKSSTTDKNSKLSSYFITNSSGSGWIIGTPFNQKTSLNSFNNNLIFGAQAGPILNFNITNGNISNVGYGNTVFGHLAMPASSASNNFCNLNTTFGYNTFSTTSKIPFNGNVVIGANNYCYGNISIYDNMTMLNDLTTNNDSGNYNIIIGTNNGIIKNTNIVPINFRQNIILGTNSGVGLHNCTTNIVIGNANLVSPSYSNNDNFIGASNNIIIGNNILNQISQNIPITGLNGNIILIPFYNKNLLAFPNYVSNSIFLGTLGITNSPEIKSNCTYIANIFDNNLNLIEFGAAEAPRFICAQPDGEIGTLPSFGSNSIPNGCGIINYDPVDPNYNVYLNCLSQLMKLPIIGIYSKNIISTSASPNAIYFCVDKDKVQSNETDDFPNLTSYFSRDENGNMTYEHVHLIPLIIRSIQNLAGQITGDPSSTASFSDLTITNSISLGKSPNYIATINGTPNFINGLNINTNKLTIDNNGNLNSLGASTLSSASISNNLNVSGITTLSTLNSGTSTLSSASISNNLSVSGSATIYDNISCGTINNSQQTTIGGSNNPINLNSGNQNINLNCSSGDGVNISQNLTVGAAMLVKGIANMNFGLNLTGNANIYGNLNVQNTINQNQKTTIGGNNNDIELYTGSSDLNLNTRWQDTGNINIGKFGNIPPEYSQAGTNNVSISAQNNIFIGSWNGSIALSTNSGSFFLDGLPSKVNNALSSYHIVLIDQYGGLSQTNATWGSIIPNTPSSERYKENIKKLIISKENFKKLEPVIFNYKKEFNNEQNTEFGLIAEKVYEIEDLKKSILLDENGKPESINYRMIFIALLQQYLETCKEVDEQKDKLNQQEKEINELKKNINELFKLKK